MTIGPDVGTAHITVAPSLRGWSRRMRAELRREFGPNGDRAFQDAVTGGRGGERAAADAGRRTGQRFAGGFDREVRTRVTRALENLPAYRVNLDRRGLSDADRQMNKLRNDLERLSRQRIGIDISAAGALAQVVNLRTQLEELGRQSPDVQVQADTLGAAAQLTALQRQIDALANREPTVDADADTGRAAARLLALQRLADRLDRTRIRLRADSSGLTGASSRASRLIFLILAIVPALLPIGGVLVNLAASFVATFTAAAAGVGVLLAGVLGAIVPVLKAQSELEQRQDAAASAASAYAGAQQQVANASRGVEDAERSASRAIADAARALADARRSGARAIADAEDAVRDAQDRARDAQDALNDARDEARERLAAYRDQLRGAALDESGAALSVTAARDALNQALIDSSSSQLDIDQARQALAEAEFAYDQAQQRGNDLRSQARRDRAAGVSGDQAVIDAREALADANADVAESEAALGEARADAARQVADAARNLAQAQADGARSIAAAEDQLSQARAAAAEAAAANAEAQADLAETMATLSGPARIFVAALDRAKDAWNAFVDATSRQSFGLAARVLDMFTRLLPNLVPLFRRSARAVGVLLDDLDRFGSGPEGRGFLDWLTRRAPRAIISIGRSIGNLVSGFGYLIGALADSDTGFLEMTRRFNRWARNLDSNESLQRFVDYARRMRPVVGAFIGALVDAFVNLAEASAPVGTFLLETFTAILDFIGGVDPKILGAILGALLAFKVVGVVLSVLAPIVGALATAIAAFVTAGGGLAGVLAVLGTVNPFFWVAAAVIALVLLYKKVEGFRNFVNRAFADIKRIALDVWNNGLKQLFLDIGEGAMELWRDYIRPAFEEIGRIISAAWTNLVKPALEAFGWYLTKVFFPLIRFLWKNVVRPYLKLVAEYIRFVYTKVIKPAFQAWWAYLTRVVIPVIKFLWTRVVRPYFQLIGTIIKNIWERAIRPALQAWWAYINNVVVPVIRFLWREVIRPAFDAIGDIIGTAWRTVIRPIFVALRDFVRDTLVPALETGFGAIGDAFAALKQAAARPILFVVDTIYNNGIRRVINAIPGVEDVGPINVDGLRAAAGYADGGVLPGYTPGRDVHAFTSPTGGRLALSGGEAVMRPEWTAAVGPGLVERWNTLARRGGVSALRRAMGLQRFARGGLVFPLPGAKMSTYAGHDGVDLNVGSGRDDYGLPFYSLAPGTVTTTGYSRGYGNAIFVQHDGIGEIVYGHGIDGSQQVSPGQRVRAGQWLARVGDTQGSTPVSGPHLHFGYPGGTYTRAKALLDAAGGSASLTPEQLAQLAATGARNPFRNPLARFANAIKAAKNFAAAVPDQLRKLLTMGPWGGLLNTGVRSLGGRLVDWVNGKIPGPGPMPDPFDSGGLASGTGLMLKRTIRPERVLSPTQTDIFERQVDTLAGWADGMRNLERISGGVRGSGPTFMASRVRVEDWERGLLMVEGIAYGAAEDVQAGHANHADRLADGARL